MQIPLRDKMPDPHSELALLIRGLSQPGNKTSASGPRRNIFNLLDKRAEPDYPRMIAEYKEVTSPELPLVWDVIECLKCNHAPAICPVCHKAFVRTREHRVYCSDECGSPENRERLHKARMTDNALVGSTVLLEAEQYLRTMRARLHYVSKDGRARKGSLTHEEYDAWFALYKKEKIIYINIVETETDQEVIKKAGAAFLETIRPDGYKPHRRKNE